MDNLSKQSMEFVDALMFFVESMGELNKQYFKAVAEISKEFNDRMEKSHEEKDSVSPVQ